MVALAGVSACSRPAAPPDSHADAPIVTSRPAPEPVRTWLDAEASAGIMAARAEFDEAEAASLAEFDRVIGKYRNVISITAGQYARQLAGPTVPVERSAAWRHEQQRRSAYAYSIREPLMKSARARLERETLRTLADFFRRELVAGRIARADYRRYTAEIRQGRFPGFRTRKWAGPAVHEFRGATVSPEYRAVLREVRKLWQAQARRRGAVLSQETNAGFYRTLVPTPAEAGRTASGAR